MSSNNLTDELNAAQYQAHDDLIAQTYRERQFAYQQQQDAMNWQFQQAQWDYNTQAAARDNAYSMATTMLKNGVLPDSATLASAGISQADAAAYVQAVQQAAIQSARKGTRARTSAQSTSAGESGGGGAGLNSTYFNEMGKSLAAALSQGQGDSMVSGLDKVWGQLSNEQRNQIQALFNRYGYTYQP